MVCRCALASRYLSVLLALCFLMKLDQIVGEMIDSDYISFHTLQKHLGYFNHIFRFSKLHQSDQGILQNRFSWNFVEELFYNSSSLFSEDLFGYIPDITTTNILRFTGNLSEGNGLNSFKL